MFLIIESGSTKTAWAFVGIKELHSFVTPGFNPSTSEREILTGAEDLPLELFQQLSEIYYYGAGIRNPATRATIKNRLQTLTGVRRIHVESDILATARACCQNKPGWVAILGTGSNVGYYDGQQVSHPSPSLGHVLGDEGSGFHIGKEILRQYFNNKMPENIKRAFNEKYSVSLDDVIENTYKSGSKNAYVASFASFLNDSESHWKHSILTTVFQEFFDYKILPLGLSAREKVHFSGSIALSFKEDLERIAIKNSIEIGEVLSNPIVQLIQYHSNELGLS